MRPIRAEGVDMAFFDPFTVAKEQVQEGEAQPAEAPPTPTVAAGAFPKIKRKPKPKPWLRLVKQYLELKLT